MPVVVFYYLDNTLYFESNKKRGITVDIRERELFDY